MCLYELWILADGPRQVWTKKVMPGSKKQLGKTDVRYRLETIFRRKRGAVEDTDWTAQMQFLRRREQFPLGTQ